MRKILMALSVIMSLFLSVSCSNGGTREYADSLVLIIQDDKIIDSLSEKVSVCITPGEEVTIYVKGKDTIHITNPEITVKVFPLKMEQTVQITTLEVQRGRKLF